VIGQVLAITPQGFISTACFLSREKITERINDAAPAVSPNCIRIVAKHRTIIGREVAPEVELVARQHEAPALDRYVAHGSDPGITGIGSGRAQ